MMSTLCPVCEHDLGFAPWEAIRRLTRFVPSVAFSSGTTMLVLICARQSMQSGVVSGLVTAGVHFPAMNGVACLP